jgi:hypothetical protein
MTYLFALLLVSTPPRPAPVYICQGAASYAYHSSTRCEGLAWCTQSVKKLAKPAAVKLGRRPCGLCVGR